MSDSMNDEYAQFRKEDLCQFLKEARDDVEFLIDAIKDIYSAGGEDQNIASRCAAILDSDRFG